MERKVEIVKNSEVELGDKSSCWSDLLDEIASLDKDMKNEIYLTSKFLVYSACAKKVKLTRIYVESL